MNIGRALLKKGFAEQRILYFGSTHEHHNGMLYYRLDRQHFVCRERII